MAQAAARTRASSAAVHAEVAAMMATSSALQGSWTVPAAAAFGDLAQRWRLTQQQVESMLEQDLARTGHGGDRLRGRRERQTPACSPSDRGTANGADPHEGGPPVLCHGWEAGVRSPCPHVVPATAGHRLVLLGLVRHDRLGREEHAAMEAAFCMGRAGHLDRVR